MIMKRKITALLLSAVFALQPGGAITQTGAAAVEVGAGTVTALSADTAEAESAWEKGQVVALGRYHSAAIMTNGDLYCWGDNSWGQVGNGPTAIQYTPVKVLDDVASVSLGQICSAAVTKDGDLYCWGRNENGEVGNGSTENQHTPVKVLGNVASVSLSQNHYSAAITKNGDLYCWGFNNSAQVGNGSTEDQHTPVKILDNVVSVSLGRLHSAAVTKNGDLYCWGRNSSGEVGNGSTEDQHTPVKVLGNIASVSLGMDHSAAVTKDGDLYCWGWNQYGQVGNGSTASQYTPVKILDNVASVSSSNGSVYNAAVTKDGDLYCWGRNQYGQVGNGSEDDQRIPVKVLDNVESVSLGNLHSAAVTTNGDLYCWGNNIFDQVGNGPKGDQLTPVKIMNLGGSIDSSAGTESSASTEPTVSTEPGGSTEPTEGTEPSASTESTTSTEPGGSSDPTTSTEPGSSTEPTTGTDPDASTEPSAGTRLKSGSNRYTVTRAGSAVTFTGTSSDAETVTIPASVTIGGITYKVTAIAPGAFKNNKALTKVIIGKNVESIGKNAFSGCSSLSTVIIESTGLKSVGSGVLNGLPPFADILVPSGKVSAYKKLLQGNGLGSGMTVAKIRSDAYTLRLDADKKLADRHGIFSNNTIAVQADAGACRVKVTGGDWLKVSADKTADFDSGLSKLPAFTGKKIYLVAAENTGEKRTATVVVTHPSGKLKAEAVITQLGNETSYLEADASSAAFDSPKAAASRAVRVLADADTRWTAKTSAKWIQVADRKSAKGHASREKKGNGSFYIRVKANGSYKPREGYVTVSAPGLGSRRIKVTQNQNVRSRQALLAELKVTADKKTLAKGKKTALKFVYPAGLSKSDIRSVAYSSSKPKVVKVSSDGVLKAVRKGKAAVSAKVVLMNGKSKVFRLKITVGKRKVVLKQA